MTAPTSISCIPKPFILNCLKHHLGFIRKFISSYSNPVENLRSDLSIIGHSQFDLYYGVLSTLEIYQTSVECINSINASLIINKASYIKYMHDVSDYFKISLTDGSEWVLREGFVEGRYIHLHPARYSKFTTRIRANVLKSVIAACIIHTKHPGLEEINQVRMHLLNLEQLKENVWNRRRNIYNILLDQMNSVNENSAL